MSARVSVWIYCDGSGDDGDACGSQFPCDLAFTTAHAARKAAKRTGWVSRGAVDLCPECAAIKALRNRDNRRHRPKGHR